MGLDIEDLALRGVRIVFAEVPEAGERVIAFALDGASARLYLAGVNLLPLLLRF